MIKKQSKVSRRTFLSNATIMASVMARESAYTGKAYTWDEITQSDLNLMPDELHLGNVDMRKYVSPLSGTSPKIYFIITLLIP